MLVLDVEYLLGVAFAAEHSDRSRADFPPQPDRVFAALTAAWGSRGRSDEERGALEWLEVQEPPLIAASDFVERSPHDAFVPPGDDGVPKVVPKSGRVTMLPEQRRKQARQFPGARPADPIVRFAWRAEPTASVLAALNLLASDTAYVGHSASLTRCRFSISAEPNLANACAPRYRVYEGRLAELERAFQRHERLDRRERNAANDPPRPLPPRSSFDTDWIVLEDCGGASPDVRALAIVAKKLRDTVMSGFGRRGLTVPSWVSGHAANGSPSQEPHLAIVPMMDVGWAHAEGRLMGLGLILPRCSRQDYEDRLRLVGDALWALDDEADQHDAPEIQLCWAPSLTWRLSAADDPSRRSLQPRRWNGFAARSEGRPQPARVWQTATPIVLDRFPKGSAAEREADAAATIARACTHIGLPAPTRVQPAKHSAVRGAVSAYPSGNGPEWTGWTLPESLRGRPLAHAVIEFPVDVFGPVVVGAGRYVGLGLCLPTGRRS